MYSNSEISRSHEAKEKEVKVLSMKEATKLLHGFFGFSHGNNAVLKFGEVIYRNSHGQHKLPEGFANPDSPAPQAIANFAGNIKNHSSLTQSREVILATAVKEAAFLQKTIESPYEQDSFDIWRNGGRQDFAKPIFTKPELEVIRIMVKSDGEYIKMGRDPKFLPILRDPSLVQKMQLAYDLFTQLGPQVGKTIELQRAIMENDSADDDKREAAAQYLDVYKKVISELEDGN